MSVFRVIGVLLLCGWQAVQARPVVLASIEPLAMAAREIVGDVATVETLLTLNQTTHDQQLSPSQQRTLLAAPLLLWLGKDAEPAIAKRIARRTRPSLAMTDIPEVHQRHADHDHDHGDHHHHHDHGVSLDGHLWLSAANMREFAKAMIPLHAHFGLDEPEMTRRVTLATARWLALEVALREQLAPHAERAYVSHHDAWGYFYEAMEIRPVITLSDNLLVTPGARTYTQLASRFRAESIHCVLAEPEANLALLKRLCTGQCAITSLDPLGRNLSAQGYSELLTHVGEQFVQCLSR